MLSRRGSHGGLSVDPAEVGADTGVHAGVTGVAARATEACQACHRHHARVIVRSEERPATVAL